MLKGLDICPPTSKGKVKRPLETAKEPSDAPESIPKRSGPTGATEVPTEGIKSWVASIRALITALSTCLSRPQA